MIASGTVTGREIKINRDSGTAKMMLQVEITDPEDIQSVELMRQAGEDTNPPNGSRVIIIDVGSANRVAVASDDGIVPTMDPGEKKLYSTSGGLIKAFINFLSTGVIEINGTADFAVRFNELKTAFDELQNAHNVHKHTETGTITSIPDTISAASLDDAKVDDVLLPGVGPPA